MKLIDSRRTFAVLMAMSFSAVVASTSLAQGSMSKMQHGSMSKMGEMKTAGLGLDGYCPVCIIDARKWEKGNSNYVSKFDGVSYAFPNASIKAKFDANPQKYVPALNGDCIVCYAKAGKRMPGSVYHAAFHKNRLYLFPGAGEKKAFLAAPATFENADVAAKGECVVCLAMANKHVAGSPKHTVIHNGLRYLFPSSKEADAFRKAPADILSKVSMKGDSSRMMTSATKNGAVKLVGRSGCAACEFGVTPLGAPDQLGLAVVGANGRVTVVEDAHQLYPQIYKDRFEGKKLAVEGHIVKSQGKFDWLKASSVQVVN